MANICANVCSQVDVLQLHQDEKEAAKFSLKIHEIGKSTTTESGASYRKPGEKSGVTIIIANAGNIRQCAVCRKAISSTFAIPDAWWADSCKRANGYFGFEEVADESGKTIEGCTAWALLQIKTFDKKGPKPEDLSYVWNKLNSFSRWYKGTNHSAVILFSQKNTPAREEFQSCLLEPLPTQSELEDPFWIYPRLANEISKLGSASVWATRDLIRDVEKKREKEEKDHSLVEPNYSWLHEISRHVVHVSETLKVGALSLEKILSHQEEYLQTILADPKDDTKVAIPKITSRNIRRRLAFSHHLLLSNLHRSEANYARIQSETTLAFNKVSQEDSNISVQIADHTRTDSAAMRTIALVTMLFLPATFISAIFSTSFFNSEGGVWKVSDKIWIFWLVAVCVTGLTFLAWWRGKPYFAPAPIDPAVRHQISRPSKEEKKKEMQVQMQQQQQQQQEQQVETQLVVPKEDENDALVAPEKMV